VSRADDTRRDRELLGGLASGNADALGELYDRHAASLYRHALVLARHAADAEDLVQAVFVRLATTGAELLGVREPANYLHRMLHTAWIDVERRRTVGARVVQSAGVDSAAETGRRQPSAEDAIDAAMALQSLAAVEREAIVLHLTEGFSFREIGRITGVSLFTAAGRYRQGIVRLRTRFGVTSGEEE
jgi:RNA polymerase sigma-70 factor (ECF subfamily)